MTIENFAGEKIQIENCLGCEYKYPNGEVYKSKNFNIIQDAELPILGFLVISPIRHVEKYNEFTYEERHELTDLTDKTISLLNKRGVAEEFNVIFEEKKGIHFHVWIMPRAKWMLEMFGKVLKNLKLIQEYALSNLKTEENISKIKELCIALRKEFCE